MLDHPAVVSLLHDADVDYREIQPWHITRTLDSEERVSNDEPVRVEVSVSIEDTALRAVLNERLAVLEISEG